MTFTVTYRDKTGARREECVEAISRDAAFAVMRARGIAPTAVRAGATKPRNTRNTAVPYIIAVAFVLLLAGGAWWFLRSRPETAAMPDDTPLKSKAMPKEVAPAAPAKTPDPVPGPAMAKTPPAPKRESLRNPNLSDEKREELYARKLEETPIPEASSNRLFRTGLEQVIGWVFTTELGDMPPPLPPLPDHDLVHLEEILELKNEVREIDTERQSDEKNTVAYVKKELKNFIAKGGNTEDFLKYYHDELKSAYAERSAAQERVMTIMHEDPAVAVEYMKEANEALASKGIKGIVLPERTLMRMGIDPKSLKGENNQ